MKILHLEHAAAERVAHVGVEPGGHGDEVGPVIFQIVERPVQHGAIRFARRARRDGIIETVVADIRRAGAGIKRIQVDGKKRDARPVEQDRLRAVAVMHVEIENRDALGAGGRGFERGDGDVVQVAKAHCPVAGGMMAGRPHQAENTFAPARGSQRVQRGGDGGAGVAGDIFVIRRVGIEILRLVQTREVLRGMGAQNLRVLAWPGSAQSIGSSVWLRNRASVSGDALGAFGMAGIGIAGAAFVGDDFHTKI